MNDLATTAADAEFDISDMLTDPVAEAEGVWCNFGKGREVKIARDGNPRAASMMRAKYRANRALLDQDDDSAYELNIALMTEVMSQEIIKGIRVDGVEIKYTYAKGMKLLAARDFRDKVSAFSKNMELYIAKSDEDAVKS